METTQEKKTFKIGDRQFELKDNLTLKERESILPIMKKLKLQGLGISLELSLGESVRFLSIVLKPVDQNKVESSFFEQINEQLEVEIFSAFFLSRLVLTEKMMNDLQSWRQNLKTFEEISKS